MSVYGTYLGNPKAMPNNNKQWSVAKQHSMCPPFLVVASSLPTSTVHGLLLILLLCIRLGSVGLGIVCVFVVGIGFAAVVSLEFIYVRLSTLFYIVVFFHLGLLSRELGTVSWYEPSQTPGAEQACDGRALEVLEHVGVEVATGDPLRW